MLEIVIAFCLFVGGGVVGYIITPKAQIYNITNIQTQTQESYQKTFVVQGQITIVDTKTNLNINVKDLTNLIEKFIITNYSETNFTNKTGGMK